MTILPIPDIHGRDVWKLMVEIEKPDKVIFLGDYFDSAIYDKQLKKIIPYLPGHVQVNNFKEIIEWKIQAENEGIKVVMLIGNHDFHYFNGLKQYTQTSGFQVDFAAFITQILEDNKQHLQMCHVHDNYLFTHAGVSSVWLQEVGYEDEPLEEYINDLWRYKPLAFMFNGTNAYGDDVEQSPIWIRPRSLMKANKITLRNKYIQIVGHTGVEKIDINGRATGGRYYFIDTLGNKTKEYIVIEDKKITVKIL
jgi:predicted phosphodiesterase